MTRLTLIALAALSLAAPTFAQDSQSSASQQSQSSQSSSEAIDFSLPDGVDAKALGSRDVRVIAVQTMLDRSRHSPGVIDGYTGGNTNRAIRFYRKANGLSEGSAIDDALVKSLVETQGKAVFKTYTITEADVKDGFQTIPSDFAKQSELDRLGYTSAVEMFGERFHMDQKFLKALNPDADFTKAGTKLTIIAHGDESLSADIARLEVRKSEGSVIALDGGGNVVASYPATIGSSEFPSPSGNMQVNAIAAEPTYFFDPEDQKWGPDKQFEIPAGPNNPIGGTWIDLGKEGYGIHGSPDPRKVSKRSSHGCVRLTNWDAEELAKAVSTGTPVEFL